MSLSGWDDRDVHTELCMTDYDFLLHHIIGNRFQMNEAVHRVLINNLNLKKQFKGYRLFEIYSSMQTVFLLMDGLNIQNTTL